jgi:hypothetical protein
MSLGLLRSSAVARAPSEVVGPGRLAAPLRQPGQQPGVSAADPVVADLDRAPVVLERHPEAGRTGASVLDDIGERFGAEEADARLDRLREPQDGYVEFDRNGEPGPQAIESSRQAAMGQDRGVDSRGDLAELLDPTAGILERLVEQIFRRFRL